MKIGIIGGGMLGLSLAYFLTRAGASVTVLEGKSHAGGLLDTIEVNGARIDKSEPGEPESPRVSRRDSRSMR